MLLLRNGSNTFRVQSLEKITRVNRRTNIIQFRNVCTYFLILFIEHVLLDRLLPQLSSRPCTIHRPRSVTCPITAVGHSYGDPLKSLTATPGLQYPRQHETRPRSCSSHNQPTPQRSRPSSKHWCTIESSTRRAYQARTCQT